MARIDRSEYPAIAQFVADGMNVRKIAAQFECTPAGSGANRQYGYART